MHQEVILGVLEKAPQVGRLWADGGYAGPNLEDALKDFSLGSSIKTVPNPKEIKGFTVLYRRSVEDIHMDVAAPTPDEGLRADLGELPAVGAACGLPVLDAMGGARANAMKEDNNLKSMTYD